MHGGFNLPKRAGIIGIFMFIMPLAGFVDYLIVAMARGLGCHWFYLQSEFKFKHKTVKRPKAFKSLELKEAFHAIGSEISSPVWSNGQKGEFYRDPVSEAMFSAKQGFQEYSNPNDQHNKAIRSAVNFFVNEGILIEYWQLLILCFAHNPELEFCEIPNWDQDGNRLESGFDPAMLSAEQKNSLIGREYAVINVDPGLGNFPLTFPPKKRIRTRQGDTILITEVPDDSLGQTPAEEMARRRRYPRYRITEEDFLPAYRRPLELVI